MAEPIHGLEDFARLFAEGIDEYPYYSVILYTPENGLDRRLHEYVVGRWLFLNSLTGKNSLLAALEDRDAGRGIADFRPEEVYDIARELGVSVADVPALVFFTSPLERTDTLVLRLGQFMTPDVTDADLTDFFRGLAAIVDECSARPNAERLDCLRRGVAHNWPADSHWRERTAEIGGAIVSSTTKAASILQALSAILGFMGIS